jgi:hypothetical protein
VNQTKDGFVVTVKITSDLSSRFRSHLLDHVEQLLKLKRMLTETRVCEIVELRLTVFTPVLLGIFSRGSLLDYRIILAVSTCHRLAEAGETETLKTTFS